MIKKSKLVETQNGALTNASTGSEVLNLFSLAGAMRNRDEKEILAMVEAAWNDSPDLALRTIFFLADIREGQGERRFFKIALAYLIKVAPEIAAKVIELIPEYSRWDLVYEFEGTSLEDEMFSVVKKNFFEDKAHLDADEDVSLLGKWLKSINTDSDESRRLGRKTVEALGISLPQYRKTLSALRAKIDVVEKKMCAKEWDKIDLNHVPGNAFKKYSQAWSKHVPEKLEKYLEKVESGELKMKSSVLYPYHILQSSRRANDDSQRKAAELQWRDMPNYMEGSDRFVIPVIDTSGSMTSSVGSCDVSALEVAVSLGMYVTERLTGPFKNHYISFSDTPILDSFRGATLAEKYDNMKNIVANTNIEAVFDIILRTAIANQVPVEEMPSQLLIFSDMEFDSCVSTNASSGRSRWGSTAGGNEVKTLFQQMKTNFANAGYELPDVVFWDLNSRSTQFPVSQHESGAGLVSGFSPATLKSILSGKGLTPMENMLAVLDNPRYAALSELFNEDDEENDQE